MGQYGSLGEVAARAARWQILRNVTTSVGVRLIRGQLVHGYLRGSGRGRELVVTSSRTRTPAEARVGASHVWYSSGSIPSSAARLRLEGMSGLGANTQIDPAVPGIISASGTAAGNIFTGIADVFTAAGGGSSGGSGEAEASGADAFIDPGAGSSFFESTGGKVVVIGGIALALLATALIVIPKKKSAAAVANRRRNRRRNGGQRGYQRFRKGAMLAIQTKTSAPGKGLSYPSFTGTALEPGITGTWDVVDVLDRDSGVERSVYGFSIARVLNR